MFPNAPQNQNQSSSPASLPPVSQGLPAAQVGSAPAQQVPLTPAPAPVTETASLQAVVQAKQLVAQYQHDPFRLSGALRQLKSAYIAERFHITSNSAEN